MNNEIQLDSLIKKMAQQHQPELPSPGLIWWRAQILKKLEEKQRIERPIVIMRLVAAVAGLAMFLSLLVAYGRSQSTVPALSGTMFLIGVAVLVAVLAAVLVAGWRSARA